MRSFLNVIEKILTMLLAVTYFFSMAKVDSILMNIFISVISVFTFCTSLVDIIRIKTINIKFSILNIFLILILLLNIYRPFIDSLLIKGLDYGRDSYMIFNYSLDLLNQNFLLVTVFVVILFVLNFKTKNS